ncbi:hypothetical protein KC333_g9044 [Hortaea werneckii]|nr:hypothetical protein KC333_g9044 [Hortaea werneckii]KAI7302115.1 hypothetical protein KC326_g9045 [Hortaea werneckii]
MTNRASITIYHSCDAPTAKVLHHFKKGIHKRPRCNQDIQPPPLPTEKVFIPRRHGILEPVLRCPLPNCKDCATTAYEGNELTLTVAKSHGITGVNLRPSRTAKTAAERLQDGLERGKWIFSREAAMTSSLTDVPDRTQRFATFHPQAATFARVLGFLRGVPLEVEVGDSTPQEENFFESSENGSGDPSGPPLVDAMPVGAFHGDFGAPTATRDEGNTWGNQGSAHYRFSAELKPGQKVQGGDIVFPRLMPTSLRGSAGLHHRQNVHTWPPDGTLERRPTYAGPFSGGSLPFTQQQLHHHPHHHHRQNGAPPTNPPQPFPHIPSRLPTTTTTTTTYPAAASLQRLPPRPRDPNIMPTRPSAAAVANAEDLAHFANGLAADKRLLEDAGLVAQGRRKKVRL